ncbi:TPA: DUF504 domain-containing protein [Candidatus Woesearchaeota archaeon]|nr:DUF504 domain-containing protein [Candidatus Woesearchaeota archaeon]
MFQLSEKDKHYSAALIVLTGIIFFWRGLWDVLGFIPVVENPFVSLFIGLLIMTFSGVIFNEFDPFKARLQQTTELLHQIESHKYDKSKNYAIKYYDEASKKHHTLQHHRIKKIESNFIVYEDKGKEIFIPMHRIHEIHQHDKVIWKK